MATHKYDNTPSLHCSQGNLSETGLQGDVNMSCMSLSPLFSDPCLGSIYMHNSGGTAEVVTLLRDAAVFNPMGKDQAVCLSLSPKTHFPKTIHGQPLFSAAQWCLRMEFRGSVR